MTEDDELLFRIQHLGSEPAKDKLIRKYYDSIYAYAYRRTQRVEDSLDLTQEIFVRVIRALPCFDRKRASFKTWLYSIASNCINDHCRRYQVNEELREELPDGEGFERMVEHRALANQIMDFLRRNEEDACRIVELKIFAELTFEEIGSMLGLSPNTAKTRYYSAIKKCRKEFEADAN